MKTKNKNLSRTITNNVAHAGYRAPSMVIMSALKAGDSIRNNISTLNPLMRPILDAVMRERNENKK